MKIPETSRLILRHLRLGELDSLFALYRDPDMIRYIPGAPRNYEEARRELVWHMNRHQEYPELGLWATIHKESHNFID